MDYQRKYLELVNGVLILQELSMGWSWMSGHSDYKNENVAMYITNAKKLFEQCGEHFSKETGDYIFNQIEELSNEFKKPL